MSEKLPQKTTSPLEKIAKESSAERPPVIESMHVRHAGVLIRVTFPREKSIAKAFMLVSEPTTEQGMENIEKMSEEHPEYDKKIIDEMIEVMDSVLVFRSKEEAQQWFNMFSYTCTPAERQAIADFLEIENKED